MLMVSRTQGMVQAGKKEVTIHLQLQRTTGVYYTYRGHLEHYKQNYHKGSKINRGRIQLTEQKMFYEWKTGNIGNGQGSKHSKTK